VRIRLIWLASLASLALGAGCKGGGGAPAAPECEPTLGGAIDRMVGEARRSMSGSALARVEAIAPQLRQALHSSCAADEWSAQALRCFGAATLQTDLDACTAKLTHEQWERVRKKLDPLLEGKAEAPPVPVAVVPAPVPPVPEPARIAEGSGSGSAAKPGGVGQRPPDRPRPPAPPAPPDCRHVVVEVKPACIKQYCSHHPTDLRCEVE
jgi:hypothetical protein